MKQTFSTSLAKLLAVAFLALLLAACERPLQPDADTTAPPETGQSTQPAAPLTQPTPATGESPAGDPITEPGAAEPGGDAPAAETPSGADQQTEGEAGGEAGGETPAAPDETSQKQDVVHTVQSGDTLYSIALQYGLPMDDLIRANTLPDPNRLAVGDQILVPLSGNIAETNAVSEERIHFVAAGETLFRIGLAYGFTVEALAQYNGLANPNDLDIGQQIRIPPSP